MMSCRSVSQRLPPNLRMFVDVVLDTDAIIGDMDMVDVFAAVNNTVVLNCADACTHCSAYHHNVAVVFVALQSTLFSDGRGRVTFLVPS
eukprot:m.1619263 g.1619263  ORF g.1619263 m.1619263 type:complete len:89 (-) comp25380_c1_seq5:1981-2247(-)